MLTAVEPKLTFSHNELYCADSGSNCSLSHSSSKPLITFLTGFEPKCAVAQRSHSNRRLQGTAATEMQESKEKEKMGVGNMEYVLATLYTHSCCPSSLPHRAPPIPVPRSWWACRYRGAFCRL